MLRWPYVGAALAVVIGLAAQWYWGTRVPEQSLGRPVEGTLERVICMAPSVTETVFALGQADRVVGVSDFSGYPPEALRKPRCGGWMNPNFEVIAALKPDGIIIQGRHQKLRDYAALHHVRLVEMEMNDLPAILDGIRTIGEVLGACGRAEAVRGEILAALDSVRATVRPLPKLKVLLVFSRVPGDLSALHTVGPKSFLSQILDVAGGANLFADMTVDYPQASKEAVVARQPDVILEMQPGKLLDASAVAMLTQDWEPLSGIPAVRKHRIHVLTEDYALIPGPRVGQLAWRIAGILHPEVADAR